jgi:hypothetical protein
MGAGNTTDDDRNTAPFDKEGTFGADALRRFQSAAGLDVSKINLWATSPERSWYLARRGEVVRHFALPLGAMSIAAALVIAIWGEDHELVRRSAVVLGSAALVGLLWCAMPYAAARGAFRERSRATAAYRVDIALKDVTSPSNSHADLPLNGLFELNRRQLDEYQEMTKRQQRIAFQLTWAATMLALAILVAGTALSLRQNTGSESYVVGGLTGLGTLLSGFLSKTFYDRQNEASQLLDRYYEEPSMTGRLLAAERLVRGLDESSKRDCIKAMVDQLLHYQTPARGPSGTTETTEDPAPT